MSNKIEAELFHTLRNVNDLAKTNVTQALLNAVSAGTLALDEYTVQSVSSLVSAAMDQSVDIAHTQVVKVVNSAMTERKKPTGRKTTKA